MSLYSWLFPEEKITEEEYAFAGDDDSFKLKASDKPTKKGTARTIKITLGPSYLDGEIEVRGVAWILTVANPGQKGKGVSYLLIRRFAELALRYQATSVKLGTPVNQASVDRMGDTPADRAERPGAQAAVHVYSQLGYDVATRESAAESSRTPQQLLAATVAKTGKWTNVDELMAASTSLMEQLAIEFF